MNEDTRHAIAHAQYMVKCATPENPDVCFDYEVVATLLEHIEHLRAEVERLLSDNGYTANALGKAEAEVDRLKAALQVTANNLDSVGAHHYASWARAQIEGKLKHTKSCATNVHGHGQGPCDCGADPRVQEWSDALDMRAQVIQLQAEVERLRAAEKIEQGAWEKLVAERDSLRAEVERLRAALRQSLGFLDTAMLTVNEEVRRKTREVVRAALRGNEPS